jgi:hypothetical protein
MGILSIGESMDRVFLSRVLPGGANYPPDKAFNVNTEKTFPPVTSFVFGLTGLPTKKPAR